MLTVKWIIRTPYGEVIRMYEASEVCVAYRNAQAPSLQNAKSLVAQDRRWEVDGRAVDSALFIMDPRQANFAGRSLDCGTVYVMNEAGATVGKYVLSDIVVEDPTPLYVPVERPVVDTLEEKTSCSTAS